MAELDVEGPVADQLAWWDRHLAEHPEKASVPEVVAGLRLLRDVLEDNPLQGFEAHSEPQRLFFEASTHIIAAFAGNRFGKTTSLVVRAIRECVDRDCLPAGLREHKRFDGRVAGWIVCPTEEKIHDTLLPTFQKWVPKSQLKGGVWDKAWNGSRLILTFANGSTISFKTYKQDASTLGGAALHFVGYDEPPPRQHRDECMTRLLDYGGYEMFAMTPLKTNTGWIRRDIFKQRDADHITVIRGSMHDNPLLDEKTKKLTLAAYESDLWARAREFGDFVDVGGLIYQDYASILRPRPKGDDVRLLDPCVSIDPGMKNAAFIFGGFDNDNTLHVFDELLIQDGNVNDYAAGIKAGLQRWGIKHEAVSFVIDPAYRIRGGPNAENLESALGYHGIYCIPGQNAVEAGIQQVRSRIQHKRLWISEECRGLIDEMDEYAAEDRPDGEFKPIKQNDHRCDALRYQAMYRPYDHVGELEAPKAKLGWTPGQAPPMGSFMPQPGLVPNGFMSAPSIF